MVIDDTLWANLLGTIDFIDHQFQFFDRFLAIPNWNAIISHHISQYYISHPSPVLPHHYFPLQKSSVHKLTRCFKLEYERRNDSHPLRLHCKVFRNFLLSTNIFIHVEDKSTIYVKALVFKLHGIEIFVVCSDFELFDLSFDQSFCTWYVFLSHLLLNKKCGPF